MRAKPSVAFSDALYYYVGSFNINNVTIESNTAGRKRYACIKVVEILHNQVEHSLILASTSAKITFSSSFNYEYYL